VLYRELFSPDYVSKFPNVTRWFTCCVNQPQFMDVIGKVEFAKTEKQAIKGGGGHGARKEKKGGDHKESEEEANQVHQAPEGGKPDKKGKKDKKDKQPKGDTQPREGGAEGGGKGKKGGGKKQKEAEHGEDPAEQSASDALEDAAERERAAEAKKRNVLDELPPSKMVLDDVKRLYFKERPYYKGFWDEFWGGGLWDSTGYCAYYSEHKFPEENTLSFMTGNAVGGFLQRLEKARKYMWGVLNISCANEDTPPYYITGAWIFRGPDIPFEMKDCSDSELYNWTRLDFSKEADRKVLMDEFQADHLKHGEVTDRRFIK